MTKRLIFCFDGTENDPNDARPEKKWFGLFGKKDRSISNIFKLHLYFGGDLNNNPTSDQQHSFYYAGIGSYGSWLRKKINAALAPEKMDIRRILNKAGGDLQANYKAGDEIYIFGFSRGAALARRFASLVQKYVPEIKSSDQAVRFMAVFDTVASIGVPNLEEDRKPRTQVVFENMTISNHVKEAIHLVSIDETRIAFSPTLMNKDQRVTEVWFPGVHSDVGGGFTEHGLSDISLEFLISEMKKRCNRLEIISPDDVDVSKIVVCKGKYTYTVDDIAINPDCNAKLHSKKRPWPLSELTLDKRDVRVNENDHPSKEKPLVHESMVERASNNGDYRPPAMISVAHMIVKGNGEQEEYSNMGDHVLP